QVALRRAMLGTGIIGRTPAEHGSALQRDHPALTRHTPQSRSAIARTTRDNPKEKLKETASKNLQTQKSPDKGAFLKLAE
uniref:hypothetical protein n=1 Tax=Stenotrophomonas sp. PS02298 TaxID=2991424 RepID=UPI00249CD21F